MRRNEYFLDFLVLIFFGGGREEGGCCRIFLPISSAVETER
jgi:hypothetical protein